MSSFTFPTRLCAAALLGALTAVPALAAPTVAITGPAVVQHGSAFQLAVSASGFTDLYAYQFDVTFDAALFDGNGVSQGAFLSSAGSTFFDGGTIDNTAGTISFVFESLIGPGDGANGAGDLAYLSFDAMGSQLSSGSFAITNFQAYDSALNLIDVTLQGLTVEIPEPSALSLALLAMGAGLVGSSKRARRARSEPETQA